MCCEMYAMVGSMCYETYVYMLSGSVSFSIAKDRKQ
jgi:hypothetical protein